MKKISASVSLLILILIGCGGNTGSNTAADSSLVGGGAPKTGGVSITNIYSTPKELGVGDILYADLNGTNSLDFSGVKEGAEFVFVLANTAEGKGSFSAQVSGALSEDSPVLAQSLSFDDFSDTEMEFQEAPDLTEQFHDFLRSQEEHVELEEEGESVSLSKSASEGLSLSISEGERRKFKVLGSLNSISNYVEVEAVAECVGENIAFYVDERVTEEMLSASDINTLCARFEKNVEKEIALFGESSDVNQDGKVVVLFTPQVNRLGASGGGIVTGFFNAADLSTANPASNFMEILFVMVPDPKGIYGSPVSHPFAMSNLLPSVLVHELQHLISFNQHVLKRGGKPEEGWLNEALSHFIETHLGEGVENPSRYQLFLQNPSAYSLTTAGSPGLGVRGMAYLFLQYLFEQSEGETFISRLLQTSETGVANIESAYQGEESDFDQFGEFFLRWSVVLAMTDAGITQDPRYVYQSRVKDSSTGNWKGVCLRCDTEDNRGTILRGVAIKPYSGSLQVNAAAATLRFYAFQNVDGVLRFNTQGTSGEAFGILIRVK